MKSFTQKHAGKPRTQNNIQDAKRINPKYMVNNTIHNHRHEQRQMLYFIVLLVLILSSCQPAITPTPTAIPATATAASRAVVKLQPITDGPVLLRSGISLRSFAQVDAGSIKLALHPQTGDLYIL